MAFLGTRGACRPQPPNKSALATLLHWHAAVAAVPTKLQTCSTDTPSYLYVNMLAAPAPAPHGAQKLGRQPKLTSESNKCDRRQRALAAAPPPSAPYTRSPFLPTRSLRKRPTGPPPSPPRCLAPPHPASRLPAAGRGGPGLAVAVGGRRAAVVAAAVRVALPPVPVVKAVLLGKGAAARQGGFKLQCSGT